MRGFWKRSRRGLDLEAELRSNRPEPPKEFVQMLAERMRAGRTRARPASVRVGFAAGLTALMLVALGAFGGLGYAKETGVKFGSAVGSFVSNDDNSVAGREDDDDPADDQYDEDEDEDGDEEEEEDDDDRGDDKKIVICHKGDTIRINQSKWPNHKRHGDYKRACRGSGGGNGEGKKIVICHKGDTIRIKPNKWPNHKRHGDYKGACRSGRD